MLEEGAEGVRLMTVHTAKGLEFPVVILADMTANLAAAEPDRHVDAARGLCAMRLLRCAPWELLDHEAEEKAREAAEGVRVAYVAATRARDLLVVPVVGDIERDGWIGPLNKAVYPPKDRYRRARPAPAGCTGFGEATVLARPDDYFGEPESSVQPGLHRPQTGAHDVLWFDPAALKLGVGANFGLRQEEILAAGGDTGGLAQYDAWRNARAQAIEQGERMQYDLLIPSAASAAPAGVDCPVELDATLLQPGRASARVGGRRYGTLVHLVLRDIDLAGGGADADALARMHGRLLGSTVPEVEAAAAAGRAAIGHPLIERARAAARCHREYPVRLRLEDNRLLEGVIDLAFQERDSWIVVDFKTGADLAAYQRQLRWYGAALARLTGLPVRGWILGV